MLVAAYARVSTGRQEQEQTIENQVMAINEKAKTEGHTIVKFYKDEGWSGSILERPDLDLLRIDARKGIWEAVLIYDPDRMARRYSFQELVMDELQGLGIKVLFVTTPPAKDDTDRLLYGVKGLFAEYERTRITERFRLGKLRNAREGHLVTSRAPYGYRYIQKRDKEHGHYEINEGEASVVRMLFDWLGNQELTMRKISKRLYELGIPPPKNINTVWKISTLGRLFRNESYIGKAYFNRTIAMVPTKPKKVEKYRKIKKSSRKWKDRGEWIEIKCPPIVEDAIFQKAQQQLRTNYRMNQRNKKNQYLLAEKINCTCGYTRAGEGPQHGKHLYYRCTDRVNTYPLVRKCYIKGVNARIADKLAWDGFVKIATSPKTLEGLLTEYIDREITEGGQSQPLEQIERLEAEKSKLLLEEKRYLKAYGAELVTFEAFEEAMKEIKRKKGLIDTLLANSSVADKKESYVKPTSEEIEQFCNRTRIELQNADFNVKRAILVKFIDKIVADQEYMSVSGYIPFPLRKEAQNVGFKHEYRDCGIAKCGQINAV
ncbi:MAG: recombinase family protein [Candidatus Shapirobacteria bacterium]|jgi:site-specific DNA recombinase